ncbi:MAG: hypothetical protein ACRDRL_19820 [Sciscionella sp.]
MSDTLMNRLHPGADGEFNLLKLLELPFPTKWAPKAIGDTIEGTVTYARDEVWYDNDTPVYYLDSEDGLSHKIVASPVVLRRQMAEFEVSVGDVICVRYDGEGQSSNSDRKYKKFTVTKEG